MPYNRPNPYNPLCKRGNERAAVRFPRRGQAGMALITMLIVLTVLLTLGIALMNVSISTDRQVQRAETRAILFNLSESGVQEMLSALSKDFDSTSKFTKLDAKYKTRNSLSQSALNTLLAGAPDLYNNMPSDASGWGTKLRYSAIVCDYGGKDGVKASINNLNTAYIRTLRIRAIGWIDLNNSGGSAPDAGEPSTIIEQDICLDLSQAHVFDYTYFVNNYGWMTGFNHNTMWINGDMRANGDFNFTGGTINGQIIGSANPLIRNNTTGLWGADGVANVTGDSLALTNADYTLGTSNQARQAYDSAKHGALGDATFLRWKELLYDQQPDQSASQGIDKVNGGVNFGSVIADANGTRGLMNQGLSLTGNSIPQPLEMPDLSDINYYKNTVSANYTDKKQLYLDGTSNLGYNQPSYLEVWDTTKLSYKRITGSNGDPNGVVGSSQLVIGDVLHPIKIHGPVTVLGDIAIRGVVQGQGTIYAGRNVHIIGDIIYADPPSFKGTDPNVIDNANEKKSALGLCATGSVFMGDSTTYDGGVLDYMKPPTTRDRRTSTDAGATIIPAFDATNTETINGKTYKKYQSLLGDDVIHANALPVSRIDGIMYTNNCAGGKVGVAGLGFTVNGSVISKDEAMVVDSLTGADKMTMNYDARIKESTPGKDPLIDIQLPRTPHIWRSYLSSSSAERPQAYNGWSAASNWTGWRVVQEYKN